LSSIPFIGELCALFTAFLWSVGSLIFVAATKRLSSYQVNITRLILAAIYLGLSIAILHLDLNISRTQIINLSISGIIGLTLGDTFLFKAFQQIGARISMLIMSLAPAISAILAYFVLGETLPLYGILGIILTIFGVSIVVLDRNVKTTNRETISSSGIIYAVLGAIGQGVGLIFAKMAFTESSLNGFVATEVRIIASLILLIPIGLATRRYKDPIKMFINERKASWLVILGSVLGPFLGISFSLIAIEYTKVGIAATIMATTPIIMLPLVKIFYKEKLATRAIVGAFTAVAGVAILFLR
jgi:drug/metabolite transporter (DMT)-like permease